MKTLPPTKLPDLQVDKRLQPGAKSCLARHTGSVYESVVF